MNLHAIANFLAAVSAIAAGLFVYLRNKRSRVNLSFFLLTISASVWQIGTGLAISAISPDLALIGTKIGFLGVAFIPVFSYRIALCILGIYKNKTLVAGYILAFLFSIPLGYTPLILQGVYEYSWGYFYESGPLHPLFMIFFAYYMLLTFVGLFLGYRKEKDPLEKNRKKYFFAALFIAYIGIVDFLPTYGIKFYPCGYIFVISCVLIFAYAIKRYNLMAVRIALTKATIFMIVYGLILIVPFIFGFSVRDYALKKMGIYWWLAPVFLMGLLAYAGPFIHAYLQHKAESRLRREEFLVHKQLNNLAKNMMFFTDLETLLKLIVHQVAKAMKVNSASIYLRERMNSHYRLRATWSIDNSYPEQKEFAEGSPLVEDALFRRQPIFSEELKFNHDNHIPPHMINLQAEIKKTKAAVIIPAFKADSLFGFLLLGPKRDNKIFTQDDLNILLLLANQAVLAIENAQFLKREKVLLAERCRRDALADIAPGVAHQFNNRLMAITSIAGAQAALLGGDDVARLDSGKLASMVKDSQNALDLIVKETLRGRDIAKAILKKGEAKFTCTEEDLGSIIQSSVELLKISRTKESLEGAAEPDTILDIEEKLPKLILSESLMQDIFYNLIDNARDAIIAKDKAIKEKRINYTEATPYKGKIIISACKKGNKVVASVKDNGIGIEKENMNKLFVAYFTTKGTAHKGTGMGLWAVRSFIEDLKGEISVSSEYARGTTFIMKFPIHAKVRRNGNGKKTFNHR